MLCPSYPTGTGIGAICTVDGDTTSWFGEVVSLTDPRVVTSSGAVRTAGLCLRSGCAYWLDGCQLGAVVASVAKDPDDASSPPCPIRDRCRWRLEHGPLACAACEGLVRDLPAGA